MCLLNEALEEHPQETKFFTAKSMLLLVTDIIMNFWAKPRSGRSRKYQSQFTKTRPRWENRFNFPLSWYPLTSCNHWRNKWSWVLGLGSYYGREENNEKGRVQRKKGSFWLTSLKWEEGTQVKWVDPRNPHRTSVPWFLISWREKAKWNMWFMLLCFGNLI